MQFRFVILGAGNIAGKFSDAVARVDGCTISAVASKSLARSEAFARNNGIDRAFDDYEEMLKTERPDCAYIATTCDSHPLLSTLCVEHGIPVLCEKAMFSNEEQARSFFAMAEQKGVFSMEALWSLFLPANLKAREWVHSGKIGKLVCASFDIGFAAQRDMANRYFNPNLGGGAANDLTVYALHILPWVTGQTIKKIGAEVIAAPSGVDETEVLLLSLSGGLPVTVRATLASRPEERMTLCGTGGRIVVPRPHMAQMALLFDAEGREVERYVDSETQNGFVYEIEEAMRCIRTERTESAVVSHSATRQVAGYIHQIHETLR
ncbi:MAG: Gfo/Idh/MocA family oxidoreductase [Oscillospiraceae bacterium]|nr:Gfo/Idh/MocA family oxidoreductase [Oscillospiraceae bacterium]